MKCDLHVHSVHSGMCTTPAFLSRICRESYSDPLEVYARLKKSGMNLVTLTDHDSIGAAEVLRKYPDFFVSEEVTSTMPSGTQVHIGVYDLSERQHIEVQRRRDDLMSLLAYLTEKRLIFSVNHVFSSLTGRRELEDFDWFASYFPAMETRSGQMLPFHNLQATRLARNLGKARLGGSDSHALPSVGTAFTEVPGARDKDEFLQGIRAGRAITRGSHGSYFRLTRDIYWIAGKMMQEKPWTAALLPLAAFVPLGTLAAVLGEMIFARRWSARLQETPARLTHSGERLLTGTEEVFAWP